jgi:hypothetical protein
MTKQERVIRSKIEDAGEVLERWFRRLNRAVTAVNDQRRKLKRLHKQLVDLKKPKIKEDSQRAGVVPLIPAAAGQVEDVDGKAEGGQGE